MIISCGSPEGNVQGHYTNKSFDTNLEVSDIQFPQLKNTVAPTAFEKDYFIDFFSNGSYTMNLYNFESGSYDARAGKVILYPEDGEKWELSYKLDATGTLAEFTFPQADKAGKATVNLTRMEHQYKADYPYTKEFNEWRNKPASEIGNNELIEKLKNHLQFMKAYLTWAKKVDLDLDLKQMSGPLRYSNSGFQMRRLSSTGKWCEYFAEEDCQEVDYILREVFKELEIEWNFTYDRIAMLGDGLGQLSKDLDNQKEYFDE